MSELETELDHIMTYIMNGKDFKLDIILRDNSPQPIWRQANMQGYITEVFLF